MCDGAGMIFIEDIKSTVGSKTSNQKSQGAVTRIEFESLKAPPPYPPPRIFNALGNAHQDRRSGRSSQKMSVDFIATGSSGATPVGFPDLGNAHQEIGHDARF